MHISPAFWSWASLKLRPETIESLCHKSQWLTLAYTAWASEMSGRYGPPNLNHCLPKEAPQTNERNRHR